MLLIITGPGRSGTSLLARFCREIGYDPGGKWCEDVDAGLEDPDVVRINDALARLSRGGPIAPADLDPLRGAMAAVDRRVVKDPRFSFGPHILRAWHSVRQDLAVVYTYRTPEQCLRSRGRVPRMLSMPHYRGGPDVVRHDLADCVETMMELAIPFRMLLFPQFLDRFHRVYAALTGLGLSCDYEQGRQAWDRLVDRRKVHFPAAPRPAPAHGAGPLGGLLRLRRRG